MQQDVKIEVSSQNLEIDWSRTRAYIKQETEDNQYCDVCDKTYDTIKISYVRHLVQFHGITLPGPSDIIQNMDDNPFLLHLATAHNEN
ncbi:hypothetical protein HPULCUR_002900 [Helicostylum pulchrum]|uniref:C2H2-type domain-containing protein n=1 Tax=Helicostylum pulchrum TaxID=562976 RepID=A0ABP9XTS8_9FUNG